MSKRKDAHEAFGIRIGPCGIDIKSPGQTIGVSADGVHGCERVKLQDVRRGSPGACAAGFEAIGPVGTGAFARLSASARWIRAPIAGFEPDGMADDRGHRWS